MEASTMVASKVEISTMKASKWHVQRTATPALSGFVWLQQCPASSHCLALVVRRAGKGWVQFLAVGPFRSWPSFSVTCFLLQDSAGARLPGGC
jgi:hypothetical protein